jgi:hypothetical protein
MIENCQHMQRVIDVPNELNDIKSHIISLLGINHFTHKVILEGVRPCFVPNSSAIVYTLFGHCIYIVRAEKKQCLSFVYAQGSGGEF